MTTSTDAPHPPSPVYRILPRIDMRNEFFWHAGADGVLRFQRCDDCTTLIHPPLPSCPVCASKSLSPTDVSGRATVATYTINHQAWMPGPELPYVVAIVEIVEQPDVRLTTNIVGCAPDEVAIGMAVRVVFEHHDDPKDPDGPGVFIPLFEPDDAPVEAAT